MLLVCKVRPAYHVDCPKHRFVKQPEDGPGESYLYDAYKQIFTHMAPCLGIMADLLQAGRPAARVMLVLKGSVLGLSTSTPGRNAPCPCGSGIKYKRCCGG